MRLFSTAKPNLKSLKKPHPSASLNKKSSKVWFPKTLSDLDLTQKSIFEPNKDLKSDHQAFSDTSYTSRRFEISKIADSFSVLEMSIPTVKYTKKEEETWRSVYDLLAPLHLKFACEEYLSNMKELQKEYGFSRKQIPQLQDVSEYLQSKTGFRIVPTTGMLTQRDFLSFLAFKIFTATQYIRHHSDPFYSPEPDVVHELMGHVPMLANQEFADFSQMIGLASLGASDEDIKRLGNVYLFSIEFGLIKKKDMKIYGAGILSSAKEIENAMSGRAKFHEFEPVKTCEFECPLSDLQTDFFWSSSFLEAKQKVLGFVKSINKGFETRYNKASQSIEVV